MKRRHEQPAAAVAMNPVDVFCAAFVIYHAAVGLVRGFVYQLVRLVVWIGGLYLTRRYSGELGERLLQVHPELEASARWVAWFAILGGVLVIGFIVLQIAKTFLEKLHLAGFDRLTGLVFGAGKAALVVVLVMVGLLALARHFGFEERLATCRSAHWSALVLERSGFALPDDVVADYVGWAKTKATEKALPLLAPAIPQPK